MSEAEKLIDRLRLEPHPEGGWFRETLRTPSPTGGRDVVTAILFLLDTGQRSHWHRVDATEIWLWHNGAPLDLLMRDGADVTRTTVGGNVLAGEQPQATVSPGQWQAAEAARGWALVSCVVAPGFDFAGFDLPHPADRRPASSARSLAD